MSEGLSEGQCEACGRSDKTVGYSERYKAYLCEECEETARRMDLERNERE